MYKMQADEEEDLSKLIEDENAASSGVDKDAKEDEDEDEDEEDEKEDDDFDEDEVEEKA